MYYNEPREVILARWKAIEMFNDIFLYTHFGWCGFMISIVSVGSTLMYDEI